MYTLSRVQAIKKSAVRANGPGPWRALRVVVTETDGIDISKVTLSPGDRLLVENRTCRTLRVAPLDFFGNPFSRFALDPGETSPPMVVKGLWFQVELHADGREFFPLDIYLAPNEETPGSE